MDRDVKLVITESIADKMITALRKTKQLHEMALEERLKYTRYREVVRKICPLCDYAMFMEIDGYVNNMCDACPWVIITGQKCVASHYDKDSRVRIIEIDSWILYLVTKRKIHLIMEKPNEKD